VSLSPKTVDYLLSIRFGESDVRQMSELAERSEAGILTDGERVEFDGYLHVGNLLAVMPSKARRVCASILLESGIVGAGLAAGTKALQILPNA
jgi:hypothetical protein